MYETNGKIRELSMAELDCVAGGDASKPTKAPTPTDVMNQALGAVQETVTQATAENEENLKKLKGALAEIKKK